jgi:hypothetical protein
VTDEIAMAVNAAPHPSPHRDRVNLVLVWLGFLTGPIVWAIVMTVTYGFASQACYPAAQRLKTLAEGMGWVPGFTATLYVIAIVLTAITGAVAWRTWNTTRREAAGHPLDIGEGRSRFLGLWGLMTSALFVGLLLFNLINTLLVPPCAT